MLQIKKLKRYTISNYENNKHKYIFKKLFSKFIYLLLAVILLLTCSSTSKEPSKNNTTPSTKDVLPTQTSENMSCVNQEDTSSNTNQPKYRKMGIRKINK